MDGTEWLRSLPYVHTEARHKAAAVARDTLAELDDWGDKVEPGRRAFSAELSGNHKAQSQARAAEWHGGRIRRSEHNLGMGHGLIPWYVPEGADFDVMPINSTLTLNPLGEQPWSRNVEHDIEDELLLQPYHERADFIAQQEGEDWDLPCRRPPAPHYYGETFSEELDQILEDLEVELTRHLEEYTEFMQHIMRARREHKLKRAS